jgi:superfamily II RNA helicase
MYSFLRIPNTSESCPSYPPEDMAIQYPFPLDPFQQWAVDAIHQNHNVLVTAKTGSGKTLVAEYAIAHALKEGKRVFYTTPIKSLSNQKYHDLKKLFPYASVGLLTGDIKNMPDSQILVLTTEIVRNLLFKQSTATASLGIAGAVSMENVGTIIFDECHYIGCPDRGHVWEESLILTPPHIRLVLLSATIDNPEGFAAWLGEIKQVPMCLLKTSYRIVPLIHGIFDASQATSMRVLKTSDEAKMDAKVYRDWLMDREKRHEDHDAWKKTVANAKRQGESAAGRDGKVKLQSFQHQLNECIQTLQTKDLLPALFFVFSRKECERYADKVVGSMVTSSETADIKHIISFHLHRHMDVLEKLPQYHQITRLLERGIAFHHSGMLPLLKEIVELLFTRGFIKILFCTESLAVGLNMPARSVVFLDLKKPTEGGFRPLNHAEYQQMAGRAGRRGKDTRGYVFYLPSREPLEVEEATQVLSGSLTPLTSRIQFHYDFLLKAIHMNSAVVSATAEEAGAEPIWSRMLKESYWAIQRQSCLESQEAEVTALEAKVAEQRQKLTCDQRMALEQKGLLDIQVRTLTNSKQKAAKRQLQQWEEEHRGPVWNNAFLSWKKELDLQSAYLKAKAELDETKRFGSEERLGPVLNALKEWDLLDEDGHLTHRGVLATEANEANPMLMVELYLSGKLKDASAAEIVGALAMMIGDREALQKSEFVSVEGKQAEVLAFLEHMVKKGLQVEKRCGVCSSEEFWSVAPFWCEVVTKWLDGADAGYIANLYELYEGNMMRGFLKINNLVDEWLSIATFCGDVEMLDKLKDVPQQLLRGVAQPESLYLRL